MIFHKYVIRLFIAATIPSLLGGSSASSQTADAPNSQLYKLTEEKNRVIAAERNLSAFINRYSNLISGFEQSARSFQDELKRVESNLSSRKHGINEINEFISGKLEMVINPDSKTADINRAWSEYRVIKTRKNPCDDSITSDAYADMLVSVTKLRAFHNSLSRLIAQDGLAAEHKPILVQARKGTGMMSAALKQADAAVDGYKSAIEMPKACELFRSFDIILALASSAAEANETSTSIDKINISEFLDAVDSMNKANQAIATARRMLTSYEASFIRNMRAGYLQKSLSAAGEYPDVTAGIIKSLLESKQVLDADKGDLQAKADQVRASIAREIESMKITQTEGRRNLLLTRARNLYAAIGKVARDPGNPATDSKKKALLDYAKANLGMPFPGRYLVPLTPTTDTELDLDSKFDRADQLLLDLGGR